MCVRSPNFEPSHASGSLRALISYQTSSDMRFPNWGRGSQSADSVHTPNGDNPAASHVGRNAGRNRFSINLSRRPGRPSNAGDFHTGDYHPHPNRGDRIEPENLRNLRELLRQRYALDLEIWSLKSVGVFNRPHVERKMEQADALLRRIRAMVAEWDRREYFRSDLDYEKFKEVKARIELDNKRAWMKNKPWDEDE
jgi:hypothetical protein